MRQTIIIVIMMLFASTIFSQLSYDESFLGTKTYYHNENKISKDEFKELLFKNNDSKNKYNSYKALKNTSYALDGLALLSIGYYWTGDKRNGYLYSALGLAFGAYLFDLQATKKLDNAISVSNNGLGLSYRF